MIRLGILGIGAMGQKHAQNVHAGRVDGMRLSAVADPSPERAAWAAENLSGAAYFEDPSALLQSDAVDAVLVAGPHHLHSRQAAKAVAHGKHVMVEKPVGIRASQIEPIVEAAKARNLVYCCMFNQRISPVNQRIHRMIRDGELGPLRRVTLLMTNCYRPQSYFDAAAWRATWSKEGGGMLVNQLSHRLDLLTWWLGLPVRVRAHLGYGKWHDIQVDDDVNVFLDYGKQGTATLVASTGDCPGVSLLAIQGDRGKLSLEAGERLRFYRLKTPESEFSRTYEGGFGEPEQEVLDLMCADADPAHLGMLQNFADSIAGRAAPVAPVESALDSLRLTQAIYLSDWQSQDVALPADNALFDGLLAQRVAAEKPRVAKPVIMDLDKVWKK